jgi:K+-sensing histidine kinase KdpD
MKSWIRRTRDKGTVALRTAVLGDELDGDIAVIVSGNALDTHLVSLGAHLAKGTRRKLSLISVLEVPRTLPLHAVPSQEMERVYNLLSGSMDIAHRIGSETVRFLVQARDAVTAIVDEAKDHHWALLLVGLIRDHKTSHSALDPAITTLLLNAPCRVWLVQGIIYPTQELTHPPISSLANNGTENGYNHSHSRERQRKRIMFVMIHEFQQGMFSLFLGKGKGK